MADEDAPTTRSHVTYMQGTDAADTVPAWLRIAAAWGWRLIVVGVVVVAAGSLFTTVSTIVIPVIIALFIAAPLEVVVARLQSWHIPRGLGSAIAILGLFTVVSALVVLAGAEIVSGFDELRIAALQGFNELITWLSEGPLHISAEQLQEIQDNILSLVQGNALGLASGALSFTGTIGGLVAGTVIALLSLFFFMRDGSSMWGWAVGLLPDDNIDQVDRAGNNAWHTLRRYTQTSVFVAFVDAVGIGVGAWILGVPLALPIGILVFLFSFIPLFGATLSGIIAVLVALVDGGPITALIMAGIVLLVQQIEGNVLYPWLFGKVSSLHPMVILLTVAAGTLLLGLVGAIIAVPVVAFFTAFARGLQKEFRPDPEPAPLSGQLPELAHRSKEAFQRVVHTGQIRIRGNHDDPEPPTEEQIPVRRKDDDEDGSRSS
ncbi:AI-2E family transporter [Demequina zhanjiangensis]|uniref:AI-2E family transporter n=1 Tax=Demequina zhanjiangensis TaxID=3051659 RepID=A0ABT8G4M8_9MICO|nr:AI-2E family transporter [Demequina sp. SYSU T00b26]MDN4474090.1 AI-2E family transporter [Demequina sp. SYSU T00b26]